MFRQIRLPTGVPRGNHHGHSPGAPSSVLCDSTGDVVMEDAPAISGPSCPRSRTYISRVSDRVSNFYSAHLGPTIDPAITLVNNSLHCGVKRAADTLSDTCDRVLQGYVETRRSTEDGLIIKRFKRLPIDPAMATSKAQLTNTLPVEHLKALPGDQFRWTDNILAHLGAANHNLVTVFLDGLINDVNTQNFIHFPQVHFFLDPRTLPNAVTDALKASGKSEKLSILLHNHMLHTCKRNDDKAFMQSGDALVEKLHNLRLCHQHTYYNGGRIPLYKEHGLKPYGPLGFPYTAVNADPNSERLRLLGHLRFLSFILSYRSAFNQAFPVETFAGIVADLDAIRKDEPPPSYVDWPGKHQRVPGAYPEDETHKFLFDTVPMRDYRPDRLWETKHPSPSKDVKLADYSTPHRKAMEMNPIVYDTKGHPYARKGALRQQPAAGPIKKARFPSGNPAFYVSSVKVPLPKCPIPEATPVVDVKPTAPVLPVTPARQAVRPFIETWTQRQAREAKEAEVLTNAPAVKKSKSQWKDIDDFFAKESQTAWGRSRPLAVSQEKADETEVMKQLIEEAKFRSAREAEAEKKRIEEEARRKAEEERRIEEEERKKAEEERRRLQEALRIAEEKRVREEDERLAQTGQLRQPRQPIISSISAEWDDKVKATLQARPSAVLAKTPEAADLQRKDFETVVPENQWLNDEIVNGTLMHLANYVNQKAGIKKTHLHTPKCHVFNSFVGKNLVDGKTPSERMMRRAGVKKDTFFDIDVLMVPICRGSHWTLLGMRPKHRDVFHLDSLNGNGDTGLKKKALLLARAVLGDAFNESDWALTTLASPRQSNFDDCGVHTITNGICMGLGIDPSAYTSDDMPKQRLRVAAVCLNEGFTKDLTLDGI